MHSLELSYAYDDGIVVIVVGVFDMYLYALCMGRTD